MTTAAPPALTAREKLALVLKIRNDPEYFAREILGITTAYKEQLDICYAVRDAERAHEQMERAWTDEERELAKLAGPDQVSVNGANGVGKDWTIGQILVPWWIAGHKMDLTTENGERKLIQDQAKVIVSAPTHRQIGEIVWREVRWSYNNSKVPLGGTMLPVDAKWNLADLYFALGFSTDKPWNITGFHSRKLLVIVSEAHNFPEDAMTQIQRLHPTVLVLSGNPFSQTGTFFDSHHSKRNLYRAITIKAWDSPNVKVQGSNIPGLVSRADIVRLENEWGKESPFFKASVDAEFTETEDGLIRLSWLQAANARQAVDNGGEVDGGLDVAGPGKDETVLRLRQGGNVILRKQWRLSDPLGEIIAAILPYKDRLRTLNVDEIGIGYNMVPRIVERLTEIQPEGQRTAVVGINVGERPRDIEHNANLKAELYWNLRSYFEDNSINLGTDEPDPIEESQLLSLKYGHNTKGQVQMESKEAMLKRGLTSPDRAEALLLCFAYFHGGSTAGINEEMEGAIAAERRTPIAGLLDPMGTLSVDELDAIADNHDYIMEKVF